MSESPRGSSLILLAVAVLLAGRAAAESRLHEVIALETPAAAGSRSPNLAAGNGWLVMSWIEPQADGHRLRYSILDGDRWSEAREVASGKDWFVNWADFPSVVPIDDSLWAAHWLVRQPAGGYAYDVHVSLSGDRGRTWSDPVLPHDDGTPTEHGFVTLFAHDGSIGLVWLDGRNMAGEPHDASGHGGMTLRYGNFFADLSANANTEIDGLVCDCCQTDVAIADTGPVAVYRNRTEEEVRDIYVMRHLDGAWQPGRPVADDGWVIGGCPVNGPTIVAAGMEVAVAWFTGAGERSSVRMSRSSDAGATFGAPVEIAAGGSFGRTGIAFTANGDVAVSWLCRQSAHTASVCLREVGPQNVRGPVRVISGDDSVPALGVPQLARHGDAVVAAWTAEQDGKTIIRSARVIRADVPAAH